MIADKAQKIEAPDMPGLTEGRMVHYVMPDGQHRPAMIARVWNKKTGYINVTVFTDWSNDVHMTNTAVGIIWVTSILYDPEKALNTWHWIEPA